MKDINEILVNKEDSIKKCMRVIDSGAIRLAVVVDEERRLCGVVTDGNIRRGILDGLGIEETVSKVMNKNPVFAFVNDSKEKVLDLIKSMKITEVSTGVPLVDSDNVVKDFVLLGGGYNLTFFSKKPSIRKNLNKILVIGGAGYIGSVLVRKLLSKNYKVMVLDKFIYGNESLDDIRSNSNLVIRDGDTRHIEDITSAIHEVDAVVHLAELVGDSACALNPSTTQEINYLATQMIAEVCKHFQINRLVYASSCSVYGTSKGDDLLSESSFLNPVSLYAKMKIASENALLGMKDDNFLPTILRLGTVFGPSYRSRFDLVVNLLTAKAIKENKITIFGGNQWRPNVHVEDVADTIIKVLKSPIEKVGGEIFNVGMEENNFTINNIGSQIEKIVPRAELVIEEKLADQRDYKVDFSKLRNTLKIKMKKSVTNGIIEIKTLLESNPNMDYKDKKYSNIQFLESNSIINNKT
ncbi:MAG: NAD-dependent epimerase/dehydratase family protein [Nanoarchaeota archaeon]|nr:NAD-dependent epimerase/dehydratase family protein [Nanoarchaeota archaeon]